MDNMYEKKLRILWKSLESFAISINILPYLEIAFLVSKRADFCVMLFDSFDWLCF